MCWIKSQWSGGVASTGAVVAAAMDLPLLWYAASLSISLPPSPCLTAAAPEGARRPDLAPPRPPPSLSLPMPDPVGRRRPALARCGRPDPTRQRAAGTCDGRVGEFCYYFFNRSSPSVLEQVPIITAKSHTLDLKLAVKAVLELTVMGFCGVVFLLAS